MASAAGLLRPWTCRPRASPRPATRRPRSRRPNAAPRPSASSGAVSSAKPARPSTTSVPTRCAAPPSSVARAARRLQVPIRVGRMLEASGSSSRTMRAASSMVCQPVHRQRWARSARSTDLRCAASGELPERPAAASRMTIPGVQNPHWLPPEARRASAHAVAILVGKPFEGGHLAAADPSKRGHAGHPGDAVDPDRAAAALALGAAAVLHRAEPEPLAQQVEQGRAVVGRLDVRAVDAERIGGSADQLKEEPQPQVRVALGLVTWKPASWSPSL